MTSVPDPGKARVEPIILASAVLLMALPVWIAAKLVGPVTGPDAFWHLVLGRRLRQTWDFGPEDPLSSLTTQPWVYNQWLPQVVASWFEDLGGLPAVAWLAVAGRFLILALVWRVCRTRTSALPALGASILVIFSTVGAWDARPQIFGIALFVIAADAALKTAEDGRARWWLIPLTWLWAMTHGTWPLAILLWLLVACAGLVDRRREGWRAHALRFTVPLWAAVVAALTPVGPRLYTTLVAVNGISDNIQEWQPLSLRSPLLAIPVAALVLVVVAWARGWLPRPNWATIAVLVFALGCMLMYARTIAVGAVVAAPLVAEALQSVVPRRGTSARLEATALGVGVTLALTWCAVTLPATAGLPGDAPTRLSPLLASQPASVIFNEQGVGGWLYWAHPQLTPVFDTRSEVYGPMAVDAYLQTTSLAPGWQGRISDSGARVALLKADSPLAAALTERLDWIVLGEDAGFVLLSSR